HINNDFDLIGKLMIVKHIIIILFFTLILVITKDLIKSLFAQFFIQLLFYSFLEKRIIFNRYCPTTIGKSQKVIRILKLGIPLGLSLSLISLTSNIPKYMLEHFESAEILG